MKITQGEKVALQQLLSNLNISVREYMRLPDEVVAGVVKSNANDLEKFIQAHKDKTFPRREKMKINGR